MKTKTFIKGAVGGTAFLVKNRKTGFVKVLLILFACFTCYLISIAVWGALFPKPEPLPSTESSVTFNHAVDGDTFVFNAAGFWESDEDITLRLIGVDTPELDNMNYGIEAKAISESWMSEDNDGVFHIVTYPTIAETDQYGRTLAYIYHDDLGAEAVRESLNYYLCQNGYAQDMIVQEFPGVDKLSSATDFAKFTNRGFWASDVFTEN